MDPESSFAPFTSLLPLYPPFFFFSSSYNSENISLGTKSLQKVLRNFPPGNAFACQGSAPPEIRHTYQASSFLHSLSLFPGWDTFQSQLLCSQEKNKNMLLRRSQDIFPACFLHSPHFFPLIAFRKLCHFSRLSGLKGCCVLMEHCSVKASLTGFTPFLQLGTTAAVLVPG